MDSSFQVTIAPPRRSNTISKKSSTTTSKSISQPLKPVPQFINVINPFSKDKSSRTQVRAQAMRDYHRRRTEMGDGKNTIGPSSTSTKPALTAKDQTQKFRLKGEKGFRPWEPVKSVKRPSKKTNSKIAGDGSQNKYSETTINHQEYGQEDDSYVNYVWNTEFNNLEELVNLDWISNEPAIDDFVWDIEVTNQWLSTLDVSLQRAVLHHSPSAGNLDPFGAMALLITPRTEILLHYYFNERLESSWLMMPMRKGLFSLAVHDAAMFHTFLTHYVASYNAQFCINDTTESLHHRTMAIKTVNERLSLPEHLPSDGTIAAVANLAAYECSNGSSKRALVHLNGLEQMVNMRGGLYGGDFPHHIQRLLGWTDLHCANALLQRPRFPPLTIPTTTEPMHSSPTQAPSPSWTSAFYSTPSPEPTYATETIDSLLAGVKSLSSTLQTLRRKSSLPQEDIWYSDRLYHLQRQLAEIIYTPSDTSTYLNSARAIAGLLYCGHCLRDVPFSYSSMTKAVTRLNTALNLADTQAIDDILFHSEQQQSEEIFWAVALGGVASEGKAEREWYIAKFRNCCDELGMIDWVDVRGLLERSPWQDELDDAGMRLWSAAIEYGEVDGLSK